jgi:Rrf2 family iron-sulfur cluster assembly transcriptional regulator
LDLPQHFLGKILQELVPLRIISSMKGPGGGFYLTNENKKASLLEIIEAIDGHSLLPAAPLVLDNALKNIPALFIKSSKPVTQTFGKSSPPKQSVN